MLLKKISLNIIFIGLALMISAQNKMPEPCGTDSIHQHLLNTDPEYASRRQKINEKILDWEKNNIEYGRGNVLTIPVVVHVLYNAQSENISDAQIHSQITALNRDYRMLNADISQVPNEFKSLIADVEIEFCLADTDPNGNATSGITRKYTSSSYLGSSNSYYYSSQGGQTAWDRDKYLNFWVCNISGGILAYAYFPGAGSAYDGIVVDSKYFGTIGSVQYPYNKGRTAVHEVGHWLNLPHIWGSSVGCSTDDGVADTPDSYDSYFGCPSYPQYSCGTSDMFMNYMDYANDACTFMYSLGQKQRMRSAIFSYRSGLLTSGGCASGGNTGGGPGSGTGGQGNINCNLTPLPFVEDFEGVVFPPQGFSINNPDNAFTWERNTQAGYNSTASAYIDNANYSSNGESDELIMPLFDISSATQLSISFDYAYKLWSVSGYSDTLEVLISNNCSNNYQSIWKTYGQNLVTTNPYYITSSWTPSGNSDWNQVSLNLTPYLSGDTLSIKFRNITDYENNLYLDNINVDFAIPTAIEDKKTDNEWKKFALFLYGGKIYE
ncbi:MAG TPA: zinc metalloprotease [Bacteroidetes bacterium]|nr:zinc metalloprotease [Bacteroidota bacterium]